MGTYYDTATDLTNIQKLDSTIQTADKPTIDIFADAVNQEIDDWLYSFADVIPQTGSQILNDLKQCAMYEILSRWKAFIKNYNGADFWHKKYLEIKEEIINRLRKTQSSPKHEYRAVSTTGPWQYGSYGEN